MPCDRRTLTSLLYMRNLCNGNFPKMSRFLCHFKFTSWMGCRYLQNNVLSDLRGLDRLPSLEALNVSNNQLEDLSALKDCETLQTLLCSHNNLTSFESLAFLQTCPALSTVDLQDNDLDDTKVSSAIMETSLIPQQKN